MTAGGRAANEERPAEGRLAEGRLAGRLIALRGTGSAAVVVLLSPSATRFVGPLTFAALSRHPVESELMELLPDGRIGHIVIADSADAVVVAPATAHPSRAP